MTFDKLTACDVPLHLVALTSNDKNYPSSLAFLVIQLFS
jgi:hypothetical protein